ncbi:glycerol-3-phosphate dehydrogenase [Tahibacter amnicola]|uniref:Glycerol-3-phosphate dehydrogenase n=1 Tax=Tahibacter amnicola TaxID=2976241 RepID=A0ABY6BMI4_9GAMM|nr:glycerol-3-phosphate dehydrogenase [Tahibacter amnicola]UXI70265.1 glycerol-3-phosphate dehydrogenase [Tahibacter amnicola]
MTHQETRVDLLVVGGGVNGAAIARDAIGRGLSVLLCEKDDIAAHTSSASTKLIHGGLRYLEHQEFALVAKSLAERKRLLDTAPHIIWPQGFILPHQSHLRPAWMIRAGLFLYDRLGGWPDRRLPGSRAVDLRAHPSGVPLRDSLVRGFQYSDACVLDTRLAVLNALDAAERGATVLTHTACIAARRDQAHWHADLRSDDGVMHSVTARALVNATGPWATRFLDGPAQLPHSHQVRLVKGSHVLVPALFGHEYAYIFQQPDRRFVFAIPYDGDFTLIGTTDVEFHGDPADVRVDDDEVAYLCEAASRYFKQAVLPQAVVWRYSGVRPLVEDRSARASEITRDYVLPFDGSAAPILTVLGGKITTSRRLAEEAVNTLSRALGVTRPAWTGGAPLPGGDLPGRDFHAFAADFARRHAWLPAPLALRLCRHYGTRASRILRDATTVTDLGEHFGAGLYAAEVDYLVDVEWARHADDILWRRTRLGLRMDASGQQRLRDHLQDRQPVRHARVTRAPHVL